MLRTSGKADDFAAVINKSAQPDCLISFHIERNGLLGFYNHRVFCVFVCLRDGVAKPAKLRDYKC